MKYNATLNRKSHTAPAVAILELEIPDELDDEKRVLYAAHELTKLFDVHIDPVTLANLICFSASDTF